MCQAYTPHIYIYGGSEVLADIYMYILDNIYSIIKMVQSGLYTCSYGAAWQVRRALMCTECWEGAWSPQRREGVQPLQLMGLSRAILELTLKGVTEDERHCMAKSRTQEWVKIGDWVIPVGTQQEWWWRRCSREVLIVRSGDVAFFKRKRKGKKCFWQSKFTENVSTISLGSASKLLKEVGWG